jgi:hypothetical protein
MVGNECEALLTHIVLAIGDQTLFTIRLKTRLITKKRGVLTNGFSWDGTRTGGFLSARYRTLLSRNDEDLAKRGDIAWSRR